jgi:cell division protease FtsH
MPNPQARKLSPFTRTLLFWFIIIALALVWQGTRSFTNTTYGQQISYSDFLQQVDKHNIATATLVLSQNTAEVHGNLREPDREYRTVVPRASVSDLTDPLRNSGVNVEVSRMPSWTGELLNFAPLLILVGLWIFIMVMKRILGNRTSPPTNPSITMPSNTPL